MHNYNANSVANEYSVFVLDFDGLCISVLHLIWFEKVIQCNVNRMGGNQFTSQELLQ